MKAMFNSVRDFAVFNAKPHLFSVSKPSLLGDCVFVTLKSGNKKTFSSRVEQFGGVAIEI